VSECKKRFQRNSQKLPLVQLCSYRKKRSFGSFLIRKNFLNLNKHKTRHDSFHCSTSILSDRETTTKKRIFSFNLLCILFIIILHIVLLCIFCVFVKELPKAAALLAQLCVFFCIQMSREKR
jgi:hypothetical protein